jgi:hypothetical protein
LGIDLLDYTSLSDRFRRLNGDSAKRKRRTDSSTATVFYED